MRFGFPIAIRYYCCLLYTSFDKLSALHLCPQIAGDVAHSFIMRHAKEMTPEVKEIVRSRSKGVLISSSQQIEDF